MMLVRTRVFLFVCSPLFLGVPQAALAQCDQTLSVSANIASAVSGAANGSTICLNSGNYGSVDLFNMSRTGFVTLRSVSGVGAQMRPRVGNSDFIRFEDMTLGTETNLVNNCSTNIQFIGITFTGALDVQNNGAPCGPSSPSQNILIDRATFSGVSMGTWEGRLNFFAVSGGTVTNTFFGNNGVGDGIQFQAGSSNMVIGPGNVFDGISQSFCNSNGGAHCDAIQLTGGSNNLITGNHFRNSDTHIMAPDGSSSVTVTNNIFDGTGTGGFAVQFGTAANLVFEHNTVLNTSVAIDSKTGEPASTNAVARNNIHIGSSTYKLTGGAGCSGCTVTRNLWSVTSNASGTNNIIGTPSFVGGSFPATWAGWQLNDGSLGENAGTDGQDVGTIYYGGATSTPPTDPPSPPTNVRITR
jgi:Right handed beta helix region